MTEGIPPRQTVDVGSIWDMRDEPDELNGGWIGLFKVAKIEDGIAYQDEDIENALSIDADALASNYLRLTSKQAEKIEAETKEYHRQTIQPIKGPNGKVIQVGSVWDYHYADDPHGHAFIVESLGNGDVVWTGSEHQGFGTNASALLNSGEEIPMDELPAYYSMKEKQYLDRDMKIALNKQADIDVDRVFDNGLLVDYEVNPEQGSQKSSPEITYHDREATNDEKEEIERSRRGFFEWVMRERALAAEPPHKVILPSMMTRPVHISVPLLHKIHPLIQRSPAIVIPQNTIPAIRKEFAKKKRNMQINLDYDDGKRLRA